MEHYPICLIIPPQASFMQITMGEAWKAGEPRACGSGGKKDHQEEPWCQQPWCEGDPGFLPHGVSFILTFGAGFSASISQASAEAL